MSFLILSNLNLYIVKLSSFFQSMNDSKASLRRLLKYLIPVVIFSVAFNIPKFFESEYKYDRNSTDPEAELYLEVTDFRKNPNYAIYCNNWTRLMVLGIIPFCLLVYFNSKIYKDIKVRGIAFYIT